MKIEILVSEASSYFSDYHIYHSNIWNPSVFYFDVISIKEASFFKSVVTTPKVHKLVFYLLWKTALYTFIFGLGEGVMGDF